ncbi:hypothetical protein FGKAn22_04010 [Ferrigenium kumadai]|uniref:Uncharacterized protein n=1 Tax=Ferrigenium kumadai TaxID=1682490 RepID=A0AAN1SXH3_9PROT|nr:hypothetical protein [Ferrigenium kumadai]BBI98708.1 hypothetical protein FGKAn22_04010 [Ferrigenium kumadai]
MHQQFSVSLEESTRAKWPHEIFLINLVFNHILVFASTLGVFSTFPYFVLVVPVTSFCIIGYIEFKSRQASVASDTWFVRVHWRIAAKRNRTFMKLLTATLTICGSALLLSKMMGWAKIPTIALIGGVGLLPFMVALLVLIVMGNDSMYQARHGTLPKRLVEQDPEAHSAPAH